MTWDYMGWKTFNDGALMCRQSDWNQTLLTTINCCAAQIIKENHYGSGNAIRLHPRLMPLISDLMYYDVEKNMISGRFRVLVDVDLRDDAILVFRDDRPYDEPKIIEIENF